MLHLHLTRIHTPLMLINRGPSAVVLIEPILTLLISIVWVGASSSSSSISSSSSSSKSPGWRPGLWGGHGACLMTLPRRFLPPCREMSSNYLKNLTSISINQNKDIYLLLSKSVSLSIKQNPKGFWTRACKTKSKNQAVFINFLSRASSNKRVMYKTR